MIYIDLYQKGNVHWRQSVRHSCNFLTPTTQEL